jgi:HK97 family phage major capsid protein
MFVGSDELLEDQTAYTQIVESAFAEEMAFTLDDAIVRGTGVGQPLGILNAGAYVSVAAEGGQAADTFVAENVWGMYARLPARSLARAEWYINSALIPQLAQLQLAVGTGGVPLYIPAGGISQAPFGTLLGRPINFIEQASAPGDVGDAILADLSQYLLIKKGDIQRASSIHVYFDTDETAFRWVWRVNGQPLWTSAVTPYKGTPTVTPFVGLAAR